MDLVPGGTITAVASRSRDRAEAFADRFGIPQRFDTYAALADDPDVDIVYVATPPSRHAADCMLYLGAGKHVLCEKPFAANAGEAEEMAAAARRAGRVLMEAFHYRHHPLAQRMIDIVRSGELGKVRHIETSMCVPLPLPGNIRYRWDLAGGATMDTGAYAIHMLRHLAGAEPRVTHAEARLSSPRVDRWMRADFDFADGRTGRMTCALFSATLLKIAARVEGDAGTLHVLNPVLPQLYHRLTVRSARGKRVERVPGGTTYGHQLAAFVRSVRDGAPVLTSAEDAIANMRVIDAVYRAAGLPPRSTVAPEVTAKAA
jgi:predicted dehydrogenase